MGYAHLSGRALSEREREVLSLVACGQENKVIAAQLLGDNGQPLSTHTVGTYLRRVYAKLGVRSRTAAVARWMAEQHAAEVERVIERKMGERSGATLDGH